MRTAVNIHTYTSCTIPLVVRTRCTSVTYKHTCTHRDKRSWNKACTHEYQGETIEMPNTWPVPAAQSKDTIRLHTR